MLHNPQTSLQLPNKDYGYRGKECECSFLTLLFSESLLNRCDLRRGCHLRLASWFLGMWQTVSPAIAEGH